MDEAESFGKSVPVAVVADDDPDVLAATARLCRREGLRVVEATSGLAAVDAIRKTVPDLVLLDVNLGDMDGREVCRTLRGEPELAATFFVMVSGTAVKMEDRIYGLEGGADGYITRPISNEELRAWIRTYLRIQAAERTRRAAERALDRTGRLSALGTLAGGAGHEIANPLMGIINYAELIRDLSGAESEVGEFATEIIEEGRRIEAIIDAMRQLGRSSAGSVAQQIAVRRLVEDVTNLVRAQFSGEDEIEVEVQLAEGLSCYVQESEAVYLLTILANVCRRALIRRTGDRTEPKRIRISAQSFVGDTIRVVVADNGDGLAEEACDHAFDPFYAPDGREQDSGLELAMAYRMAERIGGNLAVDSTPGVGTCYYFDLPAARKHG